jgi:hypothetical protein
VLTCLLETYSGVGDWAAIDADSVEVSLAAGVQAQTPAMVAASSARAASLILDSIMVLSL